MGGVIGGVNQCNVEHGCGSQVRGRDAPAHSRLCGRDERDVHSPGRACYPVLAKSARVQGQVVMTAIIDSKGQIQDLQLVSGHPMLVPAAIAAVTKWRYRPYLLNGQPVEVETTITVIFTLTS